MRKLSERQIFERSISEEDVFSACRALLELNGARVYRIVERIPWGNSKYAKKSEAGIPDGFGRWSATWLRYNPHRFGLESIDVKGPLHFFIEFKRPGGKKRPAQITWIEEARADGVIAFFADSVESMSAGFAEFGIKLKGMG